MHRFYQGSTNECTRISYLQEFRSAANPCRVLLMSIQAGAVGIDLSVASEALFVELPRNIAVLRQAEARIHRKVCENEYIYLLPESLC
jgi:SNF2 family DNA or RNA helicase